MKPAALVLIACLIIEILAPYPSQAAGQRQVHKAERVRAVEAADDSENVRKSTEVSANKIVDLAIERIDKSPIVRYKTHSIGDSRMTRAISIVLIVVIVLQTLGCSAWRPMARVSEVPEDERQTSMRDQVLGKLNAGMAVRIRIRAGTRAPVIGQSVECVIEKAGPTSLTVIASAKFVYPDNVDRKLTLKYSDIVSIEYRESDGSEVLMLGLGVGVALGFILFNWALSGIELD